MSAPGLENLSPAAAAPMRAEMSKRQAPKLIPDAPLLKTIPSSRAGAYDAFDKIDGRHPWQTKVDDGYVLYPVRKLGRGKVFYFNFSLAREMGLIPAHHGDDMTPQLANKLIETFSLQIVNEYDRETGRRFPPQAMKEHLHMATRYLQLQHADKKGRTSGDGRSIWNGCINHKGTTWDVSSRGTGVTCLAPGAVVAQRALKTGEGTFGYGCGLADLSEVLGSAIFSEIFHLNGLMTERVLAVIDLGKGCSVGVRASPNLLRPAHLFLYLKQERLEPLRMAADYLIERQCRNGAWKFSPSSPDRYRRMLTEISLSFGRFAARLERDYIFAWMDWDGDNVLASGGIIDYGSIRQFGLRHDQYRYDDVERYSTNLNEQRGKARLTVQVFAQLVHFLETGRKKQIEDFERHPSVRNFDREFDRRVRLYFLNQLGLQDLEAERLNDQHASLVERLYKSFLTVEKIKTKAGVRRLADGINRPAVFKMRAFLREMPSVLLRETDGWHAGRSIRAETVLEIITSSFAKKADLKLKGALRGKIDGLVKSYVETLRTACGEANRTLFLKGLTLASEEKNRAARLTGNGAEFVVEEILKARKRGLGPEEIQNAIDLFIASQAPRSALGGRRTKPAALTSNTGRLFQQLVNLADEFQDDI